MDINEILRNASTIVANELHGGYRLFLFGSRAKGVHDRRSDIDLGIITTDPLTAKQMVTIQGKLEKIPTLLKIDLVDFNTVDDDFKAIALQHTREIEI